MHRQKPPRCLSEYSATMSSVEQMELAEHLPLRVGSRESLRSFRASRHADRDRNRPRELGTSIMTAHIGPPGTPARQRTVLDCPRHAAVCAITRQDARPNQELRQRPLGVSGASRIVPPEPVLLEEKNAREGVGIVPAKSERNRQRRRYTWTAGVWYKGRSSQVTRSD